MKSERFTDLHHHILWGIDDGPKSPKQMYEMLDRAEKDGIGLIAATSHAFPKVCPFDYDTYRQRLREANHYCADQGYDLKLIQGCEIHYFGNAPDLLTANRLPTLGQSRYVLIEFGGDVSPDCINQASDNLYRAGYLPMIAHVERYRHLVQSPKRAAQMREEYGLTFQMNCSTILNPRGLWQKRFVRAMLEMHAIDLVATDAHNTTTRPVCLAQTYQCLKEKYGEQYADELSHFGLKIERQGMLNRA